jgi:subtilase family serine protease
MKQLHRVVCSLVVLAASLSADGQRVEPRLKGGITEASRVVLAESRTPQVQDGKDLGAVSPEMVVPGMTLVFRRSAEQEAALQELMRAQQDAGSAQYRQWLTPESFAARFGVADEDIATTESWLTGHGFHVDRVARSRDRVTFSGTAAEVQAAFGAELHHYEVDGSRHFAPAADLTLPAELASMTAAVLHLSDFRPKPSVKVLPRPQYTTVSEQAHYLAPGDIATMYDLNPFYKRLEYGSGQGIAIVGQSYVNLAAVLAFQEALTQVNSPSLVLVPGSGVEAVVPEDEGESEIDLEYASGVAPFANLFLVYVGNGQNYDVFDALDFAIAEDVAPVISISYALCESLMSSSERDQNNAAFEEAVVQGQTLVAASGDSGSTACARYTSAGGATVAQQQALAVNFPADSPYVTAVGGTQMAAGTFGAGTSSYWGSASGADNKSSLLSYVSETAWNEDSAANGIAAGGGGTSSSFARPAWQSGVPGISNGGYRLVPDVSLQASISSPGYVFCSVDPELISGEGQSSSCSNGLEGSNGGYTTAGGTSFAAPIFAGFVALLNEHVGGTGQGNMNPALYQLASNPTTYATAFHDVTSGTIACSAGDGGCAAAGEAGYAAGVGYDEASGLGSIDFDALATAWPASKRSGLIPTAVGLTPLQPNAEVGVADPIQINVTSSSGTETQVDPTGSVSVSVDGVVMSPALALATTPYSTIELATASYKFVLPSTAEAGSHLIVVNYAGDATHAASTGTLAMLAGNVEASGGIGLAVGGVTVASGATGSTTVTVTPTGGYSGSVVWSLNAAATSNTTASLSACYGIDTLPVNGTTATKLSIGVGAACGGVSAEEQGAFRQIVQRASSGAGGLAKMRLVRTTIACAGVLLCGLLGVRRRRLPGLLGLVCLGIAGAGLTGCGSGQNSAGSASANASSTASYTLTLTGTDSVNGAITASTNFTLTVN